MSAFDPAVWWMVPMIILFWLVSGYVAWHIHLYMQKRQPRFDPRFASANDHGFMLVFVGFYGTWFLWAIWPAKLFMFAWTTAVGLSHKPLLEWFDEGF